MRLSLEVLAARQAALAVAEGRAGNRLRAIMTEALRVTRAHDAVAIRQAEHLTVRRDLLRQRRPGRRPRLLHIEHGRAPSPAGLADVLPPR